MDRGGQPSALPQRLSASGLQLLATATSDPDMASPLWADGVRRGDRFNVLDYFSSITYVPNPPAPDFVSGVQFAIYNRNQAGAWEIGDPTLTASATIIAVPEPSRASLLACALATLGLRRHRLSRPNPDQPESNAP